MADLTRIWPRKNDRVITYSNIYLYFLPWSDALTGHFQNQGDTLCGIQQNGGYTKYSDTAGQKIVISL